MKNKREEEKADIFRSAFSIALKIYKAQRRGRKEVLRIEFVRNGRKDNKGRERKRAKVKGGGNCRGKKKKNQIAIRMKTINNGRGGREGNFVNLI